MTVADQRLDGKRPEEAVQPLAIHWSKFDATRNEFLKGLPRQRNVGSKKLFEATFAKCPVRQSFGLTRHSGNCAVPRRFLSGIISGQEKPETMSRIVATGIDTRLKLCALWTAAALCLVFSEIFSISLGVLALRTADGLNKELWIAVWVAVPVLMIYLSVALPTQYSRVLNFIVGASVLLWGVLLAFFAVRLHGRPGSTNSDVFADLTAVFAALAVWYAWRWPTTE